MATSSKESDDNNQHRHLGWEEIMGKDLVLKRLRTGSGELAEMGTVVTCNLRGFFVENGETSPVCFEEWTNQNFKIGESDAIPGVEMALRFSRVGDLLRVRCNSRFGYGPTGRPIVAAESNGDSKHEERDVSGKSIVAIPADMDLEYELDVLAHLPDGEVDPAILSTHGFDESTSPVGSDGCDGNDGSESSRAVALRAHRERLQALTELQHRKEAGNRWFSYGDFSRSARAYSKATQIADRYFNGNANNNSPAQALQGVSGEGGVGEAEVALAAAEKAKEAQRRTFQSGDEEVVAVYVSCLNNMAACQLRLGDNAKVKDICIRVLEIDPNNHKALLRAAKAALATHDYEECDVCLQRLVDVAPPGSSAAVAAATERRRLKQAQLEYRQQKKKMSDNMAKQLFKSSGGETIQIAAKSAGKEKENGTGCDTSDGDSNEDVKLNKQNILLKNADLGDSTTAASVREPSSMPVKASTAAAVAPATTSADQGLLLLLLTSLTVLLVSVFLVVWTAKSK